MFGKYLFGESLFAKSGIISGYIPTEEFSFNTYGLQNLTRYGVHIENYTIDTPTRDFQASPVPGGHGLILQEDNYRENPITLNGWVSASNREDLEEKIHEMMRNLHIQGGILYIKDAGTFKELQTTLQSAVFENPHYATTRKKFALTFSGTVSFWKDKYYSSSFYSGNTALFLDGDFNNMGSVEADPIVILIFSGTSDITGISFESTTTGEKVSITQTILPYSVVIFDAEAQVVSLDGVNVEFDGTFPILQAGLNSFTINLTGASATYDVTAKHKNQYLTP